MRVLVACEESQTVCKAFRERGREAYSCVQQHIRVERTKKSKLTQIKNAANLGKTRFVKCIDTGKAYVSTKQAERETGVYHSHISKCCSGKAKTAGGMRWEYA